MSVWMVEVKELGYRPLTDGDWELYSCVGYGSRFDAEAEACRLTEHCDEYTHYRAVEYVRKEGRQ